MTSPHVLKKSDDEDFLVFAAEWLVLPPPALRSRCTGPIALSFLDLWTRIKQPDFFAARAQSQVSVVRTQEADLSAEVPEPDQRLAERARRVIPPPARKRSNFRGRTDSFKNDWLIAPGTRDREVRELE